MAFDGVVPLSYAKVADGSLGIHQQYPSECLSTSTDACGANAHLAAGDFVAVAKSCGAWAYIQFIGNETVSTGWVAKSGLQDLAAKVPFDDGVPPRTMAYFAPGTVLMKLVRGKGVPVCEAYLQRLNQTIFHEPPYYGRPENDQIPALSYLHRVPLSGSQLESLYGQLSALNAYGRSEPPVPLTDGDIEQLSATKEVSWFAAWSYSPRLSVSNDGTLDDLVIWRGRPGSFTAAAGICGRPENALRESADAPGSLTTQVAIEASSDYTNIDDVKTLGLFAYTTNALRAPGLRPDLLQQRYYLPLGSSMGAFEYREEYYVDTFLWGDGWPDFEGRRAKLKTLDPHLAVVHRKNGRNVEVCEYKYDPSRSLVPLSQ